MKEQIVVLDVVHIPQWDNTSCFQACKKMVNSYCDRHGLVLLEAGPKNAIWFAKSEDDKGHITVEQVSFTEARRVIDDYLDTKWPIIVGVSHKHDSYNFDGITDHFVVICSRERDDQGWFYGFLDPGTSGHNSFSKFRERSDGVLYREGKEATGYVSERHYEVTCVRRYGDF